MRGILTDNLFATLAWRGIGIIGTVIAALCCFTPVLVILFGAVGLSWLVGYLDYVLLPALFFFLMLTVYAVWRKKSRSNRFCGRRDSNADLHDLHDLHD